MRINEISNFTLSEICGVGNYFPTVVYQFDTLLLVVFSRNLESTNTLVNMN